MRALSLILVLGLLACSKADDGMNGVGPWNFKRSTLADAEAAGRCLAIEGGFMQCLGLSAMQVGGQPANVQLYFQSADKSAPLIEISLSIRTCKAAEVAADLTTRLGEPKDVLDGGKTLFWAPKGMFVRAQVPEKGSGVCVITFVTPTDATRIEDLKKGV
jgi:hypothetical protein